jgi:hypothetical protein
MICGGEFGGCDDGDGGGVLPFRLFPFSCRVMPNCQINVSAAQRPEQKKRERREKCYVRPLILMNEMKDDMREN